MKPKLTWPENAAKSFYYHVAPVAYTRTYTFFCIPFACAYAHVYADNEGQKLVSNHIQVCLQLFKCVCRRACLYADRSHGVHYWQPPHPHYSTFISWSQEDISHLTVINKPVSQLLTGHSCVLPIGRWLCSSCGSPGRAQLLVLGVAR